MNERTRELLRKMAKYGGSFAASLAVAWQQADAENEAKLEREFRPLLETYRQFLDRSLQ